jgi:hypothetical protein
LPWRSSPACRTEPFHSLPCVFDSFLCMWLYPKTSFCSTLVMCTHMRHVCYLPSSFPRHSHFQPISAALGNPQLPYNTNHVQTFAANTNSSAWQPRTPPTRRALPVCEALQLCVCMYVCIYIYICIDMKQVTSMFHCFVTYMLRINPSPQPKTRWFTSLAPASSQLKEWTRHSLERTCKLLFPASCPEGIPPHSHQTKGWHISVSQSRNRNKLAVIPVIERSW